MLTKLVGPIDKKSTWKASQLECTSFFIDHGFETWKKSTWRASQLEGISFLIDHGFGRGQRGVKLVGQVICISQALGSR